MLKKIPFLFMILFAFVSGLCGCGYFQSDYYEVHMTVVNENLFYYIDPSEGKDTLSANQFGPGETHFIYLYEGVAGIEFTYDQFFTTIQERYVETNLKNGKFYVLATTEIDNLVFQYFTEKEAWEANKPV